MRSIQQLSQLQYFQPETLQKEGVVPQVVSDSTVNLIYKVTEKSSDYFNASIGYNGTWGFSGSLGFTFSNFSLAQPFQVGGGQVLNLNWTFGVGNFYRTFSLGFTEPWFMDTPTSLGFEIFDTRQRYYLDLQQTGITGKLGRRLTWPDDYFYVQGLTRYQHNDIIDGGGYYRTGVSDQITVGFTIVRNDIDNPVFPSKGSKISLSAEFSGGSWLPGTVDYNKYDFKAEWYRPLFNSPKFVFYTAANFGYIDELVKDTPIPYFDLFNMGGNGLMYNTIPLRGYEDRSIGPKQGGRAYMKYTVELRTSLSQEPIPIYLLAFAEAGNATSTLHELDFTNLRKSVGIGARIMLQPVGLVGFDYAYGFDRFKVDGQKPSWIFHIQFGKGF
jgi:outer membrane protein insertion porin family